MTEPGAKHLEELAERAEAGDRAVMLFLVQREDCDRLALAADLDPAYARAPTCARAMERARARGVEVLCYDCRVTTRSIELGRPLPLAF